MSSKPSSSEVHDHGKSPDSGRERMSEQTQGVTAGREECIDTEINSLLMRNKGDNNIKEDTAVQGRMNGDFMKAVKFPYVTVADVEPNIEELSLAKEFGAAAIRGLDKKGRKNPSSHATLSQSSQLKQARDPQKARVIHTGASTWKRRERRNTADRTESSRSIGKKRTIEAEQSNPNTKRGSNWLCPQDGWVKANFDGAVFSEFNQSGVGVVIRDKNGAVLASCSEKILHAYKPDEVEALAALKAASLARDLGFQNVILEGDSLCLIKALKSAEDSLSPIGLLVDDVKWVGRSFEQLVYSHVKRNGNSAAHSLAKNVLRIPDSQVWMEDVPSHITSILDLDVIVSS
nr:hypothetical protein CFP56_25070 [Quercus suber]